MISDVAARVRRLGGAVGAALAALSAPSWTRRRLHLRPEAARVGPVDESGPEDSL